LRADRRIHQVSARPTSSREQLLRKYPDAKVIEFPGGGQLLGSHPSSGRQSRGGRAYRPAPAAREGDAYYYAVLLTEAGKLLRRRIRRAACRSSCWRGDGHVIEMRQRRRQHRLRYFAEVVATPKVAYPRPPTSERSAALVEVGRRWRRAPVPACRRAHAIKQPAASAFRPCGRP